MDIYRTVYPENEDADTTVSDEGLDCLLGLSFLGEMCGTRQTPRCS